MCHFSFLPPLFFRLPSTNYEWFLNFTPGKLRTYLYLHVCAYAYIDRHMLIYLWIYMYTHRYIKTQRFSCWVYFICQVYWTSPCPSLPICTPQHFTGSAPHSTFRHPIFSLSSDSQSLAIPPGGCSAQKFVLS